MAGHMKYNSATGPCLLQVWQLPCTMAVLEYRVWKEVHLDPCVHSPATLPASCTMAGVRLAHLPAFFEVCLSIHIVKMSFETCSLQALHCLIPGLIHSLKEDGGAKSIANFTNFTTCQSEILWAFRIIGELFWQDDY